IIVVLILLSRLKFEIIWMTANFFDVSIINADAVSFLLAAEPEPSRKSLVCLAFFASAVALSLGGGLFRIPVRPPTTGVSACAAALLGVSLAFPQDEWDVFAGESYVSKFSRSGIAAVSEFVTHGYMESDAGITDRLRTLPNEVCTPAAKPPHIILV